MTINSFYNLNMKYFILLLKLSLIFSQYYDDGFGVSPDSYLTSPRFTEVTSDESQTPGAIQKADQNKQGISPEDIFNHHNSSTQQANPIAPVPPTSNQGSNEQEMLLDQHQAAEFFKDDSTNDIHIDTTFANQLYDKLGFGQKASISKQDFKTFFYELITRDDTETENRNFYDKVFEKYIQNMPDNIPTQELHDFIKFDELKDVIQQILREEYGSEYIDEMQNTLGPN
jgi:hypothetical protein